MSVDPFQATKYQVGRILNAFTSDPDGNLILADIPNASGITLSEIIAALSTIPTGNGLSGTTYYKDLLTSDFSATSYQFGNEPTTLGFEYVIAHNFDLEHKNKFVITVVETDSGRVVTPQEVIAVDSDTIRLIMADTTPVSVTVVTF